MYLWTRNFSLNFGRPLDLDLWTLNWIHLDGGLALSRDVYRIQFLPRCMECRRGLTMRFLSVRPSVRLSVRQTRAL